MAYGVVDVPHVLRAAPVLDRTGTMELVRKTFPEAQIDGAGDALLADSLDPADGMAYVGCFPDLDLVCSWLLMGERPSEAVNGRRSPQRPHTYLHSLDLATKWCAFAVWCDGNLVRSLSVSPRRVYEDLGDPLPFEAPFRSGKREPDPVALGEEALYAFFGFRLEPADTVDDVDPEVIPLVGYRIS